MDRRAFFRLNAEKVGRTLVGELDARVQARRQHWLRPPYAIAEVEFLLTCTRCGACIEACAHRVVFALAARVGPQFAGTPALDLRNRGCHLCADWPCVAACEPGALRLPEVDPQTVDRPAPRLACASIDPAHCLAYRGPECGACAASCPSSGALNWHRHRPVIDPERCSGCGLCRETCIVDPKAIRITALD